MYTPLCTIRADTSNVPRMPRESSNGTYFVQVYNIVLQCGLAELKAQISWTEDVSERFLSVAMISSYVFLFVVGRGAAVRVCT